MKPLVPIKRRLFLWLYHHTNMQIIKLKFISVLFFTLVFLELTLVKTQAETAFDLSVFPPSAYLQIKPGTQASHQIELTNNSANAIVVVPRVFESKPLAETSYPQLQTVFSFPYLNNQSDALKSLTINPGQTAKYRLDFTVPVNAETREYPLTILFSKIIDQDTFSKNNTSRSKLYGAVGANLVVLISDNQDLPNQLKVLKIEKPFFQDSFKRLEFKSKLFNQGIQAVTASGSAKITNVFGKTVYQAPIYPDVVLGGQQKTTRAFIQESKNNSSTPGSFIYDPLILLGQYQISVKLTDQDGELLSSSEAIVVALPYSLIATVILAILGWLFARKTTQKIRNARPI